MRIELHAPGRALRRLMPARAYGRLLCAIVPAAAFAAVPAAASASGSRHANASATLEQCVTASTQVARSATFVGEMTAVPGTVRMMMRIDMLERMPKEPSYRAISYPGLGTWLRASPGVTTYKNLDKVTDLAAPASYRAAIHFRWVGARGRTIKTLDLRTPRCVEPLTPRVPTSALSAPADVDVTALVAGA